MGQLWDFKRSISEHFENDFKRPRFVAFGVNPVLLLQVLHHGLFSCQGTESSAPAGGLTGSVSRMVLE